MLILILGLIGSGKTLFMRILIYLSLRNSFANFKVFGDKNCKRLFLKDLINLPDDIDVYIDEGYSWLDSRTSMGLLNRFISYIILQSRKRLIDIFVSSQLIGTIDLRFRENADIIIYCNVIKKNHMIVSFDYIFYKRVIEFNELNEPISKFIKFNNLSLSYENAKYFFGLYDTFEIIEPKDYQKLIFEVLSSDLDALTQEVDKFIPDLYFKMKADNVKITQASVSDYLKQFKIPIYLKRHVLNEIRKIKIL